jgi:hypothetical protein
VPDAVVRAKKSREDEVRERVPRSLVEETRSYLIDNT